MTTAKVYKSFATNYRLVAEPNTQFNKIKVVSSTQIADYLRQIWAADGSMEIVESFFLLLLNQSNNITGWIKISSGGVTGTVADPIIIAKYAVEQLAKKVVIAHNHPSGNLQPSRADEEVTQKIKNGLKFLDITLLDHIILTDESFYSFADEGLLY